MSELKRYFHYSYDEQCRSEAVWREIYKNFTGRIINLVEATPERDTEYRWCIELGLPVAPGDCGKACKFYKPINGKSGKCSFKKFCYEDTGKTKSITI